MNYQMTSLYPEIHIPEKYKNKHLTNEDIYELTKEFSTKEIEYGILIATSENNEILSAKIISIGAENETTISPTGIIKSAISDNAKNIIFVHNHPSNITSPSRIDLNFITYLKSSASEHNIKLSDSIIIANDKYDSYQHMLDNPPSTTETKPVTNNKSKIDWDAVFCLVGGIILVLVLFGINMSIPIILFGFLMIMYGMFK